MRKACITDANTMRSTLQTTVSSAAVWDRVAATRDATIKGKGTT
jgi:spore coat protein U-like protein